MILVTITVEIFVMKDGDCDEERFDCLSDGEDGKPCTTGQCPGDDKPYDCKKSPDLRNVEEINLMTVLRNILTMNDRCDNRDHPYDCVNKVILMSANIHIQNAVNGITGVMKRNGVTGTIVGNIIMTIITTITKTIIITALRTITTTTQMTIQTIMQL